jgi:hypothetical protein
MAEAKFFLWGNDVWQLVHLSEKYNVFCYKLIYFASLTVRLQMIEDSDRYRFPI